MASTQPRAFGPKLAGARTPATTPKESAMNRNALLREVWDHAVNIAAAIWLATTLCVAFGLI